MKNKSALKALIFDIQSFSTHDGPGIRTNIFFKGCPLSCLWCANPEGQKMIPELFYSKIKCCGCLRCAKFCSHDAIIPCTDPEDIEKLGYVRHDRVKCDCCTTHDCVKVCFQNALSVTGEWMTVDDVMRKVYRDAPVYRKKGGVTVSGGDPLLYYEFLVEFLGRCHEEGINTALESELCVPQRNLQAILPYVDLYLTDLKIVDEEKHLLATGVGNQQILENLRLLGRTCPEKVCLRIPIIPGFTDDDENIRAIGVFCVENNFTCVNILPYHKLGVSKHERLGNQYPMPDIDEPNEQHMLGIANSIRSFGIECIIN